MAASQEVRKSGYHRMNNHLPSRARLGVISRDLKFHKAFYFNCVIWHSNYFRYQKSIISISVIAIILVFGFCSDIFCQSEIKISGEVIDQSTGAPIPGVIVTCNNLNKTAISDNRGYFYFVDLPNGTVLLAAKRIGYKDSSPINAEINNNSANRITILMYPEPLITEPQEILGSRLQPVTIENVGNKTYVEIRGENSEPIEQIIDRIPELELVHSGSSEFLRIRGAQLNGTLVMLDGREINSGLTSKGDISSIPFASVRKIEIIRGGNYELSGLAGSVNFITTQFNNKVSAAANIDRGSFGYESYNLTLSKPLNSWLNLGIDSKSTYSRGDFKYSNPRDSIEARRNNYFKDVNIFGRLNFDFSPLKVNIKGRLFKRNAGVPGPMLQLTPLANYTLKEEELWSDATLALGNRSEIGYIAGISNRLAEYDSPRTPDQFYTLRDIIQGKCRRSENPISISRRI